MVRQHHRLNGHEFEPTPGDSGGQRSLAVYSPELCDLETEQPQQMTHKFVTINCNL